MSEAPPEASGWLSSLLLAVLVLSMWSWTRAVTLWWQGKPAVPAEPRSPAPWGADGALLAGLSVLLAWAAQWAPVEKPTGELALSDALAAAAISGLLATLAIAWQRSNHCASPADLGAPASARQLVSDILLGIAAFAASLPIVYGLQSLIVLWFRLPSSHPTVEMLIKGAPVEMIAAAAIMAVVVAPLYEELAFRVLLQGWLEKIGGPTAWWPVIAASAVFALAHAGQGYAPAPLFVLSLGIGHLYRQTHRYAPCVAMHMAFNALSLTMAIGLGASGDQPAP